MANSFDSALVADTISQMAETVLANRLAPLGLFSTDFTNEVRKPKDTVRVPLVTATGATQTNPTNFEPGANVTIGKATVTLDHIYQPFGISFSDLGLGHRLEQLVQINMDALANAIWAAAITPVTTTAFGSATVSTASASITPGSGDLAKLWAAVASSNARGLVVNPTIFSNLIPTNIWGLDLKTKGSYGFENGVYFASSFTGAVSGLRGFSCSKEAVAVASAVPPIDPSVSALFEVSDSVTLSQLGITVNYNIWGSTANRQVNASLELMFGAGAGLTTGTMGLII
jgi:hypothetical protein